MKLYGYRDRYCFPTSSFIYLFNSILTLPPNKYNESYIPLSGTSRYPITFTTDTYCYSQPIISTEQFNQRSPSVLRTIRFLPPPPSSPSNPSNIFRVSCKLLDQIFLFIINKTTVKLFPLPLRFTIN